MICFKESFRNGFMQQEVEHLSFTLNKYGEIIDNTNLKLIKIYKYNSTIEEKFKLENGITSLQKAKLKPYFAKIDIKDIYYIGKK